MFIGYGLTMAPVSAKGKADRLAARISGKGRPPVISGEMP